MTNSVHTKYKLLTGKKKFNQHIVDPHHVSDIKAQVRKKEMKYFFWHQEMFKSGPTVFKIHI